MKKILIILGIITLSFLATMASIKYERTHPTVTGNVCDASPNNPRGLCYEDLPAGGFPFSYLYDSGGVSVMGTLGIEDHFYIGWFIADIAFYFVIFCLIGLLMWKKVFPPSPN